MFADALSHFYEAVGHDGAHGEEVVGWAEAAGREVALGGRGVSGSVARGVFVRCSRSTQMIQQRLSRGGNQG